MPVINKVAGILTRGEGAKKHTGNDPFASTSRETLLMEMASSNGMELHSEFDIRRRTQQLADNPTLLARTEKAEEEAHKKDQSILDFEKGLLGKSNTPSLTSFLPPGKHGLGKDSLTGQFNRRNTLRNAEMKEDKDAKDQDEVQPKKTKFWKRKLLWKLARVVSYWDLLMAIMTFLKIGRTDIMMEAVFRDEYFNCLVISNARGLATAMYTIQVITSAILIYAITVHEPGLMFLWFPPKIFTMMFFVFRQAFDLRKIDGDDQHAEKTYEIPLILGLYTVEIAIVIIVYIEYTQPYIFRRQALQSNRALNRDIFIKSLPPFLQRKYAVRWAEKLQTIIVLQKIREREDRGNKRRKASTEPTDQEVAMDVEAGIKAFKSSFQFDTINDKGEDAGSFATRSRHPYHKHSKLGSQRSKIRYRRKSMKGNIV